MTTTPTPTYPQFTNLPLHDGLFDQLMAAHKHHLEIEWDAQRIRGDIYAKVYLGSLESCLAASTQYLLGILLITEKQNKLIADTTLVNEQIRQTIYTTDFVLPKQVEKMDAEIALIGAQILLTEAQIQKILKEIEYLDAKILTELANTDETIADPGSLVGKQVSLLTAQRIGFAGDIRTKTSKLHSDYAAVYQSVQEVFDDVLLNVDAKDSILLAEGLASDIEALP